MINSNETKYLTWIRKDKIILFCLITSTLLICGVLLCLIPLFVSIKYSWIFYVFGSLLILSSFPFVYLCFVLLKVTYLFSDKHKQYQSKIHQLIINKINNPSNILDIGCGSGALSIKICKKFPNCNLTGLDYFGGDWGQYSLSLCEHNAKIENIPNVKWIKSSASCIPFDNEFFDAVVSCLTFHEVKDEVNKTKVILEVLRVLKSQGQFVFMDLFLNNKTFGDFNKLINDLKSVCSSLEFSHLKDLIPLHKILLNKKVLGDAILIWGIK